MDPLVFIILLSYVFLLNLMTLGGSPDRPNKARFGTSKYKWPELELRKYFGLKPLDRSKFD